MIPLQPLEEGVDEAPGFDAITEELEAAHPGAVSRYVGFSPGLGLGSGLAGVSAHQVGGEEPHWLYVSYGLTELWEKHLESDPVWSGWGYELTMRVAGEEAPEWPFQLLEQVARSVRLAGVVLRAGQRVALDASPAELPGLAGLAFRDDPELAVLETLNGRVRFLQAVALSAGELSAAEMVGSEPVLEQLSGDNPLLVTRT